MFRITHSTTDEGFVAFLVALVVAGVLLGTAAISVDLTSLHGERRELQNGADNAAIAAAFDCSFNDLARCAGGTSSVSGITANWPGAVADAKTAASNNATDGKAQVEIGRAHV